MWKEVLFGLALAPVLVIASCNQPTDDGYAYSGQSFDRRRITVDFVYYLNQKQLNQAADDMNIPLDQRTTEGGFAKVSTTVPYCEVHVVDPRFQRVWTGHEITHCARGQWHK